MLEENLSGEPSVPIEVFASPDPAPDKDDLMVMPCLCQTPIFHDDDEDRCFGCGRPLPQKHVEKLLARITALTEQLAAPKLQCSTCGSTGPFDRLMAPSWGKLSVTAIATDKLVCSQCRSQTVEESYERAFYVSNNRTRDQTLAEAKRRVESAYVFFYAMDGWSRERRIEVRCKSVDLGLNTGGARIEINNPFEDVSNVIPVEGEIGLEWMYELINSMHDLTFKEWAKNRKCDDGPAITDEFYEAMTQRIRTLSDMISKSICEAKDRLRPRPELDDEDAYPYSF